MRYELYDLGDDKPTNKILPFGVLRILLKVGKRKKQDLNWDGRAFIICAVVSNGGEQ
jgi:hypothetical protein